jgi:outer membrane protein assembly factor BamE (lipoprotein component of BamABCDE complex)
MTDSVMKWFLNCVFVLALLSSGCMSPARRLDAEQVQDIKSGVTTRREVEKKLGKPPGEINGSNQKTLVTYDYTRVKPSAQVETPGIMPSYAGSLLIRTVSILYDQKQKVERLTYYETTTPFHRQLSKVWVGRIIEEKDMAHVIKGASTVGDVEESFGPAMAKGLTVDGRPYFTWFYTLVRSRFEMKKQQQNLFVYFDNHGIVQDYLIVGNVSSVAEEK